MISKVGKGSAENMGVYLNPGTVKFEESLASQIYIDKSELEEPTNLMKQELRNFAIYNSVVSAIASGSSRMNDIAMKVGEDSAACANQIKTLVGE